MTNFNSCKSLPTQLSRRKLTQILEKVLSGTLGLPLDDAVPIAGKEPTNGLQLGRLQTVDTCVQVGGIDDLRKSMPASTSSFEINTKDILLKSFGCFQKYGKTPQIIHFNMVFHYFHHPFWGCSRCSPYFWVDTHFSCLPMVAPKDSIARWSSSEADGLLFEDLNPKKCLGVFGVENFFVPRWCVSVSVPRK